MVKTTTVTVIIGLVLLISFSNADNKTEETIDGANIILLTYHRSGSSFVGEGLSSHEDFAYYFEPLFYPSQVDNNNTGLAFEDCLEKLLTCNTTTLDKLRKQNVWILRKFGTVWSNYKNETKYNKENLTSICLSTPFHLAKTIRLRLADAIDLVNRRTVPNLKIVHLVRDPRARYNSAHTPGGRWSEAEKSIEMICSDMAKDAKHMRSLPKHVYRLVKYEDMVKNPTKVIRGVYNQLLGGLKISPAVKLYVRRHTKAETDKTAIKEITRYYSTFRNSSFDHDHWKKSLNTTQIDMIQNKCRDVLDAYGYALV